MNKWLAVVVLVLLVLTSAIGLANLMGRNSVASVGSPVPPGPSLAVSVGSPVPPGPS